MMEAFSKSGQELLKRRFHSSVMKESTLIQCLEFPSVNGYSSNYLLKNCHESNQDRLDSIKIWGFTIDIDLSGHKSVTDAVMIQRKRICVL